MTTLDQCLEVAYTYWLETRPSSVTTLDISCRLCVGLLGGHTIAEELTGADIGKLLGKLYAYRNPRTKKPLSKKTVQDYFNNFKRMLVLNDVNPTGAARWPGSASPPRKTREAVSPGDQQRMVAFLVERGWSSTRDLAYILSASGLRIQRELLREGNLRVRNDGGVVLVTVAGKGGHERTVPVLEPLAAEVLLSPERLKAVLSTAYKTHLWRWNVGRRLLALKGLATPHALRHSYATETLERSGGNLRMVQKLLGHANPATTAIYADVSMEQTVKALSLNRNPTT